MVESLHEQLGDVLLRRDHARSPFYGPEVEREKVDNGPRRQQALPGAAALSGQWRLARAGAGVVLGDGPEGRQAVLARRGCMRSRISGRRCVPAWMGAGGQRRWGRGEPGLEGKIHQWYQ